MALYKLVLNYLLADAPNKISKILHCKKWY